MARATSARVHVHMPIQLLEAMDAAIDGASHQRSAYICQAIREKLRRDGEPMRPAAAPSPASPAGQAAEIQRLGPNPAILGRQATDSRSEVQA